MKTYHLTGKAPFFTNCYMVCSDEGTAVLIDCSADIEDIKKILENDRVSLSAVLLTHGHADHIETLEQVKNEFGCPVYLRAPDALLFGIEGTTDYPGSDEDPYDPDGEIQPKIHRLTFGDMTFYYIFTPGHTPGGVCISCGDMLFCGDTLFAGTVGRTDLQGGDWDTLNNSLKKIVSVIKTNLKVLPGHNHFSTFEREKRTNPYLRNL